MLQSKFLEFEFGIVDMCAKAWQLNFQLTNETAGVFKVWGKVFAKVIRHGDPFCSEFGGKYIRGGRRRRRRSSSRSDITLWLINCWRRGTVTTRAVRVRCVCGDWKDVPDSQLFQQIWIRRVSGIPNIEKWEDFTKKSTNSRVNWEISTKYLVVIMLSNLVVIVVIQVLFSAFLLYPKIHFATEIIRRKQSRE